MMEAILEFIYLIHYKSDMMILLVVPSFNIPAFKGLAKVSFELYNGLKNRFDVEVLEVYGKKKNYLSNLTIVPLKELQSKADIVHSLVPESGAFLGLIKKLRDKKTVVTFYDLTPIKLSGKLKFRFSELVRFYTLFMWKNSLNADVIISVSSQTKKEVMKYLGKPRKQRVINPGVDERFKPMKLKRDKITLGFFANFSYKKGVDKAIEVFKIVKKKYDVKLILAGGELQTVYQRQFNVREMIKGLKDVEIMGYIPDKDVVKLYNSFDFYLFPSIEEGFGIPILEAQKCGVPVLTFEWANIPEETKAKTIQCKDVEDMARKIMYLIENKDEYRKISEKGRKYASKFTWKNFVENHIKVYESLY
jgi:glycosyltransferase involved in cell wall biosynthesis